MSNETIKSYKSFILKNSHDLYNLKDLHIKILHDIDYYNKYIKYLKESLQLCNKSINKLSNQKIKIPEQLELFS